MPQQRAKSGTIDYWIAASRFDNVNLNITEANFPLAAMGAQSDKAKLVHYRRHMETAAVVADLAKRGRRPATLIEQLIWYADSPGVPRRFPVVALGSGWRGAGGYLHVPVLRESADERHLSLHLDDPSDGWDEIYRFLAVRESGT